MAHPAAGFPVLFNRGCRGEACMDGAQRMRRKSQGWDGAKNKKFGIRGQGRHPGRSGRPHRHPRGYWGNSPHRFRNGVSQR